MALTPLQRAAQKEREERIKSYENYSSPAKGSSVEDKNLTPLQKAAKQEREVRENRQKTQNYRANGSLVITRDGGKSVAEHMAEMPSAKVKDDPSFFERLGYGAKSILERTKATPDLLWETGKAAVSDFKANRENEAYQAAKNKREELERDYRNAEYLERLGVETPDKQILEAAIAKVLEEEERLKQTTQLDPNSYGMQTYTKGVEAEQKALAGLHPAVQEVGGWTLGVADYLATAPLGLIPVIGKPAALGVMGAKAAAGKSYELSQAGTSPTEAVTRGLVSGAIEVATEMTPLDEIVDLIKFGGKPIVAALLKQAGIEATEEGISYTLNYVADKAAKDPNATFSLSELRSAVLGGAFSGGLLGGGASLFNRALNRTPAEVTAPAEPTETPLIEKGVLNDSGGISEEGVKLDSEEEIVAQRPQVNSDDAVMEFARETVAKRQEEAERNIREATMNYGEQGVKAISEIAESTGRTVEDVHRDFDAAYKTGYSQIARERAAVANDIQERAYTAGYLDRTSKIEQNRAKQEIVRKEGGLLPDDYDLYSKLDSNTQSVLDKLGKATGSVVIIDNKVPAKADGYYHNGEIHIAPDADKPVVQVFRHEFTHRMQDIGAKEYASFQKYVQTYMKNKGFVYETADLYKRNDEQLSEQGIMEEVVSRFAEVILTDEKAMSDFVNKITTDPQTRTWKQKVSEVIRDLLDKLKSVLAKATDEERATMAQFGLTLQQVRKAEKLWMDAAKATVVESKNADGSADITNAQGEMVAQINKDGTAQFSLKTYDESGRQQLTAWLDKRVKGKQITAEEKQDIIRQMDEYYDLCQKFTNKYAPFGAWSNAEVVKGVDGKPAFSVVKANGDYAMNLDFSLVCKKRRTLDKVFKEMINRGFMDNIELGEAEIAKINEIIRSNGFETACALCFVDAKRYRQAKVADHFVEMYNDAVKAMLPADGKYTAHYFDTLNLGHNKGAGEALHTAPDAQLGKGILALKKIMQENDKGTVPYAIAHHLLNNPKDRRLVTRSEFMNTDGFEAVSIKNPDILKLYNRSKGSGGPKASLSDVQYLGEILQKRGFTPARAYAVGGVRIQSFSDYIPRLVFDYMQMVADLSAKKLPAHAYTKEASFAKQFGMTGIKINLSLVPAVDPNGIAPGLDKDGNYTWYDGQSFGSDVNVKGSAQTGFELAVQLQNAEGYSANCGTIAVGISDEQIYKMLDDPDIRMVIPYHKSSLNHIVAVMNSIDKYKDYTGVQNTRYQATGSKIESKDFNYNEALRKSGDAKTAANEYLAWCEKNGYIPKFDRFKDHENYYKLLEDFSTYDNGKPAPQGAVTMKFPKEGDAFGSMAQLIEEGLEEDAILEANREKNVPKIVDEIEKVFKESGKVRQYSLKDVSDIKAKYKDKTAYLYLHENNDFLTIDNMVVKKEYRNQGIGTQILNDVIDYADRTGKTITLTPTSEFGTKTRLTKWYKANGFVENKGRNADYRLSDTMYRLPRKDAKYSLKEEKDTAYLTAVRNGDMTTAQKMVDEAAKAAGYTIKAWHGSRYIFNQFSKEKRGSNTHTQASERWFFAGDKETANSYYPLGTLEALGMDTTIARKRGNTGKLYELYIKMDNPLVADVAGYDYAAHAKNRDAMMEYIEKAEHDGNDGIILYHVRDNQLKPQAEESTNYMFRDSTQAKSADPVTYDDNGDVIPLSERFNAKNEDIRYSLKASNGYSLSEAQAEYFKDSKVRDENGNLLVMYHGTSNGIFTAFDTYGGKFGLFGMGSYFTDNPQVALSYTEKGKGKTPRIYSVFLNIKNPLDMDAPADVDKWRKAFKDADLDPSYLNDIETNEDAFKALKENLMDDYYERYEAEELITEMILGMGYDGITHIGGGRFNKKDDTRHRVYIAFEPEQIKDTNNENPTTNADIRYSIRGSDDVRKAIIKARQEGRRKGLSQKQIDTNVRNIVTNAYAGFNQEYGSIEMGEKPSRMVNVPLQTGEGEYVSRTIRTALEAGATPDAMIPTIEQMVTTGDFSYDRYTDEAAMEKAAESIKGKSTSQAYTDWMADVAKNNVTKDNVAMGWTLYNAAANAGDTKMAVNILTKMVGYVRNAAQALQATRILKKLSPSAQLYGVQRSIENLQEELKKKYGDKAPNLEIDEELAKKFLEAKTEKERNEAIRELYKDIGRQMPASWLDKWNAWRYLAMLGTARTHVRNIGGNLGFTPVVAIKNLTAMAIENMCYAVSGGKMQKNKGMPTPALLKAAWNDYANVAEAISAGGRYNESTIQNAAIQEGRVIFKTKLLEKARRTNSKLLEREDIWFSQPHYANALAQYCKAHHITAEQIAQGKAIDNARAYAMKEAMKATYRDINGFSDWISSWGKYKGDSRWGKAWNLVVEGVLPFRRTPANILARGVEYSPLGIIKAIADGAVNIRNGKMTAADVIDELSAGLTGTGLLVLGAILAAQGLVRGSGGEDEEKKKLKELQGHQEYALVLGDKSYTIDFLAPEILPFLVGVNITETAIAKGEGLKLSDILSALQNITHPILQLSCLQSLNDILEGAGYAKNNGLNPLYALPVSAVTSYVTSGIPTLMGQAERTFEEERMTTYTTKDDFLTTDMQYTLGKVSAKIPNWDYGQIPYIDAWGRTEETGLIEDRALSNFLKPYYESTITESRMEKDLERLYDVTGDTGLFPERAKKEITVTVKTTDKYGKEKYTGVKKYLTAEEFVKYATAKGQISQDLLTKVTSSSEYKQLDDEAKKDYIHHAYELADAIARRKVSSHTPDGWLGKAINAAETTGIDYYKYLQVYEQNKIATAEENRLQIDGTTITNSASLQTMEVLYAAKLNDKQRKQLMEDFGVGKKVREYSPALVKEKLAEMRSKAD